MAASRPASRDDFPMNAFALLPASVVHEHESRADSAPVSCAPEGPVQVEEYDAHVDVSAENPLGLLQLNLAHTELRETVETLYHAIETLEREQATLKRENVRLVDSSERAKADAAKDVDKLREKLQARDHEAMQMQQKMRELDRQKERLYSENSELQLKVDEHEATISSLQAAVQQLQNQQERASGGGRCEAELRRLVEMWSSKERSVAENTDHMRKATTDVQRLAEQLQTQLKQAQSELLATEKEFSTFRSFLDQHKCTQLSDGIAAGDQNASSQEKLREMRKCLIATEQAKLEVITENRVLRTKCKEFAKSIRLLSARMGQVQSEETATHNLIVKYQESADDGTQTIAELQESLVKLCDQLADERKQHTEHLSEQMRSALDAETNLRKELDVLHEKLKKSNQEIDAARDAASGAANTCTLCAAHQNQAVPTSPSRSAATQESAQGLLSPPPLAMQRVRTPQPLRTPLKEPKTSHGPPRVAIEDELEDYQQASDSAERQIGGKRDREEQRNMEQAVVCRLCNEEPFGFMVRCQKCKDPFHAGCVKKTGTGAKKRLGHIFKCSNCAPLRPTKVARCGGNEGSNKSTPAEEIQVQRHSVIPLRTTGPIARPAPPEEN